MGRLRDTGVVGLAPLASPVAVDADSHDLVRRGGHGGRIDAAPS